MGKCNLYGGRSPLHNPLPPAGEEAIVPSPLGRWGKRAITEQSHNNELRGQRTSRHHGEIARMARHRAIYNIAGRTGRVAWAWRVFAGDTQWLPAGKRQRALQPRDRSKWAPRHDLRPQRRTTRRQYPG